MYFTLVNLQYLVFTIVLFLLPSCTNQKIGNITPNEYIIDDINNIILKNNLNSEYGKDKNWDNKNIENISYYLNRSEIHSILEIQNIIESQNVEPNQIMNIILNSYKENSDSIKRAYATAMLYGLYPEMRMNLFPIMYESFNYHSPPYLYVISYDEFNNFIMNLYDIDEELSSQSKLLIGYFLSKRTALTFVKNNNEPVSAAAFLRTAFLNLIFKNSDIDTMQLLEKFYDYEEQVGDNEVYRFEYNLFSNDNTKRLEAENIIFGARKAYFSFCTSADGLDFPYCQDFKNLDRDDSVKTVKMYLFQRRAFGIPPVNQELLKGSFLSNDLKSSRVQAMVSLAIISHKNFHPELN